MTKYKNLYDLAVEISTELGLLYRDNRHDRSYILEFMDFNNWFGVPYFMKDHMPWFDESYLPKIQSSFVLWLSAYRKPESVRTEILLNHFNDVYPQTCLLYRHFINEREMWEASASWKLLDFIFSEIKKEITLYNEDEINELIKAINANATRTVAQLFADFLSITYKNNTPISDWIYTFDKKVAPEMINDAYSFTDFSIMAYCVFNSEMWERQCMIKKAVQTKKYADLWLFMALHFVCALRKGDMERLPAPTLPYSQEIVLAKILDGSYEKRDAIAVVEELTIRLKFKSMRPSKTLAHANITELKLFVPKSLKEPIGIIMSIALAHVSEPNVGAGFVKTVDNMGYIKNFFGDYFADAIGNRRFSSRRANKSYLQGIEIVGGDELGCIGEQQTRLSAFATSPGKPKGYMLATLARSHKSGIGKLAETTALYLKDARFSGYSPEFIIKQMFERGIFSFIPVILLEIYAGSNYIKLSIGEQTRLIGELGLTALQIEGMSEMATRAMIRSRKSVHDIIKNPSTSSETIGLILQNIASGEALGKQNGCLCLMTAVGQICPFAERAGCVGCGYELYTKTMMHTLMQEYSQLTSVKNTGKSTDSYRYGMILEQAVMPAIVEMLASAKLFYPNADCSELLDIMEAEFNDIDCTK